MRGWQYGQRSHSKILIKIQADDVTDQESDLEDAGHNKMKTDMCDSLLQELLIATGIVQLAKCTSPFHIISHNI